VEIIQSGRLGDICEVKAWITTISWRSALPADCDPPPGLDWDFYVGPSPMVPFNPTRLWALRLVQDRRRRIPGRLGRSSL